MATIVEYNIITKADVQVTGTPAYYSTEDSYQMQASYGNGGADPTLYVKRIDTLLKPTLSSAPNASRIVDIDITPMQADYLRILHIKCDKYFLFSSADTVGNLTAKPRELVKVVFKDYGPYVDPNVIPFTPDEPFPKAIRLINPLDINGGGTGNSVDDEPILVQVHMICKRLNA